MNDQRRELFDHGHNAHDTDRSITTTHTMTTTTSVIDSPRTTERSAARPDSPIISRATRTAMAQPQPWRTASLSETHKLTDKLNRSDYKSLYIEKTLTLELLKTHEKRREVVENKLNFKRNRKWTLNNRNAKLKMDLN